MTKSLRKKMPDPGSNPVLTFTGKSCSGLGERSWVHPGPHEEGQVLDLDQHHHRDHHLSRHCHCRHCLGCECDENCRILRVWCPVKQQWFPLQSEILNSMHISMFSPMVGRRDYPRELDFFGLFDLVSNSLPMSYKYICVKNHKDIP